MSQRLRAWLHASLGAITFAAALYVLHRELREVRYRDLLDTVAALPGHRVLLGLLLTAINYTILTGFDHLAFRHVGKRVERWRISMASFVGYAIANNVGLPLLSGASVRYRFYSRSGIGAGDLSRIVLFYTSSYWLGLMALGGWSLTFHPHPALEQYGAASALRVVGVVLLAVVAAYVVASALRVRPLTWRGLEISVPPIYLTVAQLSLSMLDWVLATTVLHVLLPGGGPPFGLLLGAFLTAQLVGLISQVPGGVGVFEGVMLVELGRFYTTEQILSSLLLYRAIYYLLPLCAGLLVLVIDEIVVHRRRLARFGVVFGNATLLVAPKLLAVFTFIAGVVLLFSGATPAVHGRVELGRFYTTEQILSSLLLYRAIYYLLPLCAGLLVLVIDEIVVHRRRLARFGVVFGNATLLVAPKLLAVFTFIAGVVLLFSGATPAVHGRVEALARFLPLGVFEASHFLGSIVGVGLLFVAQGVARRLDVGYWAATALLCLGIVASLLKAGDWEEALFLFLLLLAFVPSRDEFDRRATFFDAGLSPGWTIAAIVTVGTSIGLGIFAFRHIEYRDELWWRFALDHDAPRFLRASVGATVALFAVGVARLMHPVMPRMPPATAAELADAASAIDAQDATYPYLVYLGDKSLLWSERRDAFLMYGVQGRSWVALGDPVGPAEAAPDLIQTFLARADDYDGVPVFYQVQVDRLHVYADFGLTVVKLGEEARVPLDTFSLDGGAHRGLRAALHKLEREGGSFRVIPVAEVQAYLPQLREISNDWLEHKSATEKGFSLGFFDDSYVSRFPVAVIEEGGRIQAFANVWPGPQREELSVDLMRFRHTAPKGAMDGLFGNLMLWGKSEGYRFFSLGMAPLSGLPTGPLAPAWSRFGHLVFRYGEAFYNFQGVRAYKEKFHPQWEPRYLAYPGVLQLPRVLADITALVGGGLRGVLRPRREAA